MKRTMKRLDFKYILAMLLVVLVFSACSSDTDEDEVVMTLTVQPQKDVRSLNPVAGSAIMVPCYVATDEDGGILYIDHIEGFDDIYEEGYTYVIKVRETYAYNGPKDVQDGFGSHKYVLLEILSRQ